VVKLIYRSPIKYAKKLRFKGFLMLRQVLEIHAVKIGEDVKSLLTTTDYVFYSIDEENGLIEVANLGHSNDNNYILCPKEKTNFVAKYL